MAAPGGTGRARRFPYGCLGPANAAEAVTNTRATERAILELVNMVGLRLVPGSRPLLDRVYANEDARKGRRFLSDRGRAGAERKSGVEGPAVIPGRYQGIGPRRRPAVPGQEAITKSSVGRIATAAGVKMLVLNHFVPADAPASHRRRGLDRLRQRRSQAQSSRVQSGLSTGDKIADTRSRPSVCPVGDRLVEFFVVAANGN